MNLRKRFLRSAVGLAAAIGMVACGGAAPAPAPSVDVGSGSLTGAGATFPEPFYTKAFYAYNQKYSQVTVNYQAVGSGAGIQQYTKGTVDFGASDVPMTDSELAGAGGADSLIEVPAILGVVAIAYNLASVSSLNLDGPTLAGIFLGTIKKWNDPAIATLNSGTTLPSTNITVVHRSDGSGTTYGFTDYLSKVSPDWKSLVGTGKSVSWKAGIGGSGNQGVGQAVQQTDGAIGYVELAYVVQANLKAAALKNANGKFVKPSPEGATAAAQNNSNPSPANFSITNEPGDTTYPIASFSWLIVKRAQTDAGKGKALAYLFKWLVTDGQSNGVSLQYAALPKNAQTYALDQLKLISTNGTPVLK